MAEKTLSFNKNGNKYVAETTVNADYNLHIETEGKMSVSIFQRGSDQGKYRRCYVEHKWDEVLDADFRHAVYPKYIRIEVDKEVTKATVREAEE